MPPNIVQRLIGSNLDSCAVEQSSCKEVVHVHRMGECSYRFLF
jgi:hypothetical protein